MSQNTSYSEDYWLTIYRFSEVTMSICVIWWVIMALKRYICLKNDFFSLRPFDIHLYSPWFLVDDVVMSSRCRNDDNLHEKLFELHEKPIVYLIQHFIRDGASVSTPCPRSYIDFRLNSIHHISHSPIAKIAYFDKPSRASVWDVVSLFRRGLMMSSIENLKYRSVAPFK